MDGEAAAAEGGPEKEKVRRRKPSKKTPLSARTSGTFQPEEGAAPGTAAIPVNPASLPPPPAVGAIKVKSVSLLSFVAQFFKGERFASASAVAVDASAASRRRPRTAKASAASSAAV